MGDPLDGSDDLVNRKVLENSTEPRYSARDKVPPLTLVLLLETPEFGQGVHQVICVIIVVDHLQVFVEYCVCDVKSFEHDFVVFGPNKYESHLLLVGFDGVAGHLWSYVPAVFCLHLLFRVTSGPGS